MPDSKRKTTTPYPWSSATITNPLNLMAVNRSPVAVTKSHVKELYRILYPFMVSEFTHRSDNSIYMSTLIKDLNTKIDDLNTQLTTLKNQLDTQIKTISNSFNTHTHVTAPAVAVNPPLNIITPLELSTPSMKSLSVSDPEANQYKKIGESYVTPSAAAIPNINIRNAQTPAVSVNNQSVSPIVTQLANVFIPPFDAGGDTIEEADEIING